MDFEVFPWESSLWPFPSTYLKLLGPRYDSFAGVEITILFSSRSSDYALYTSSFFSPTPFLTVFPSISFSSFTTRRLFQGTFLRLNSTKTYGKSYFLLRFVNILSLAQLLFERSTLYAFWTFLFFFAYHRLCLLLLLLFSFISLSSILSISPFLSLFLFFSLAFDRSSHINISSYSRLSSSKPLQWRSNFSIL